MKTFPIFFRNFLTCTFQNKMAYLLHFGVPIATFILMYLLLSVSESAAFAGTQAIGMVVYFSLIQAALIVSLTLKDKEQGVKKRILISPAPRLVYVLGNGAAALVILSIQVLVFVSFVLFIMKVPLGIEFFHLLVILIIFNITGIGFAFFVCSLSDTPSGAMMIANLVVMFTSLLGGSFFPVEFMSPFMQRIAFAFPQYWVMKALQQTQSAGSLSESGLSLLILLLFGGFFLTLWGAVTGRRRGDGG